MSMVIKMGVTHSKKSKKLFNVGIDPWEKTIKLGNETFAVSVVFAQLLVLNIKFPLSDVFIWTTSRTERT